MGAVLDIFLSPAALCLAGSLSLGKDVPAAPSWRFKRMRPCGVQVASCVAVPVSGGIQASRVPAGLFAAGTTLWDESAVENRARLAPGGACLEPDAAVAAA
jgi:hypothetical protein